MKATALYLIVILLFSFSSSFGDVIPENSHYVNKCIQITNLDEFPDVSLVGYVSGPMDLYSYEISNLSCLQSGYRLNTFCVYAVLKSYLVGKDVENLSLAGDINALVSDIQIDPHGGYYDNSNPIAAIQEFYKILGFTDNNVVLFKWKKITGYNNGTPDSTETYEYTGNVSILSQEFPEKNNLEEHTKFGLYTELSPNPNSDNLTLKMNNIYYGDFNVSVYNISGHIIKSFQYSKSELIETFPVPTYSLLQGNYIIRLQYGGIVESHKLTVK